MATESQRTNGISTWGRGGGVTPHSIYGKPKRLCELIATHRAALISYVDTLTGEGQESSVVVNFLERRARNNLIKFKASDVGRYRKLLRRIIERLTIDPKGIVRCSRNALNPSALEKKSTIDVFSMLWRESILDQAWNRLRVVESTTGRAMYSAYSASVNGPDLTVEELMQKASFLPPIQTPDSFRSLLRDSRRVFLQTVRNCVSDSLLTPTTREIQKELIELGLNYH